MQEAVKNYTHCRRCGRTIKNPKSVVYGVGSVCIKKLGLSVGATAEAVSAALALVDKKGGTHVTA